MALYCTESEARFDIRRALIEMIETKDVQFHYITGHDYWQYMFDDSNCMNTHSAMNHERGNYKNFGRIKHYDWTLLMLFACVYEIEDFLNYLTETYEVLED